jgi:hypothetical protein
MYLQIQPNTNNMTHKYLTQIRTIPNYHEDQSELAKTWRSVSYNFKSASNLLIKNRKTRIISSVLGIYMILTSGFVVAFISVDNNQANAQSIIPKKDLSIVIKKQKIEGSNLVLKLEIQNQTGQTIINPIFKFQSSFENIQWNTSFNDLNNNKVDVQNSGFKLASIGPSQKASYSIYGSLNDLNTNNVAVATSVSYTSENQLLQLVSPKYLIDIK